MPKINDPHAVRANILCPHCKGSGVGEAHWIVDEFNPNGFWDYDPCEPCGGTGMHKHLQEIVDGYFDCQDRYSQLVKEHNDQSSKIEEFRLRFQDPNITTSELEDEFNSMFENKD